MNLTVGRAKQREREAHTYPHVLICGVDGCSEVGRGKTEKAAIIGLAVHRRFHHGVVGNHKTACSTVDNALLDAVGEYLEASGVSIR